MKEKIIILSSGLVGAIFAIACGAVDGAGSKDAVASEPSEEASTEPSEEASTEPSGEPSGEPNPPNSDYEERIAALETLVSDLASKIETLEQANVTLEAKVDTLEQANVTLEADLGSFALRDNLSFGKVEWVCESNDEEDPWDGWFDALPIDQQRNFVVSDWVERGAPWFGGLVGTCSRSYIEYTP